MGLCLGDNDLSNGWNDNIDWMKMDEGEKLSQSSNKPLMLVIHKSWCGACKALKAQFSVSKEIEELSNAFVMVNTMEPTDVKFAPDGGYIPRILFIDPQGTVLNDIYNESGNPQYKYYYYDTAHVLTSMKRCLEKMKAFKPSSGEL
jgi:protein-disulfide reductase (glutathione)